MTRLELRALPLRAVALQVTAALVLLAATASALDTPTATQVLLGVAVLLAATLALAVDEPGSELLDATATPFARRVARRAAVLCLVVVPVWALAHGLVAARGGDVPLLMSTLQLTCLSGLALAVAAALRRWWRVAEPGLAAGPVLLGFLIAVDHLPRSLVVLQRQTWGPPWEVSHLRWAAVLLLAASLLLPALSDPATARVGTRRAR